MRDKVTKFDKPDRWLMWMLPVFVIMLVVL